jgi:rare lipoprotein A (peptidoglycan hydrolase)
MNWIDGKNSYVIFVVMALFATTEQTTKYFSSSFEEKELNNLSSPAKNQKEVVVVIRKRMCLSAIAEGLGTSVERLCQLNPGIKDANLIYVEQKVRAIFCDKNDVFMVSWYGENFHGKEMSNHSIFNMYDPTMIAHKYLPLGTKVRITCLETGKIIEGVITDRGPYVASREFDVSYAAAQLLGIAEIGTARCKVEILS